MIRKTKDIKIAVDGWCSGNPGRGGYKGINLLTKEILFNIETNLITNNLAEYIAIIHAIMWCDKNNYTAIIYSDSKIGINWINKKKNSTTLDLSDNTKLHNTIIKGEKYLKNIKYRHRILKWNTKKYGEIPADFGRKKKQLINKYEINK